MEQDKVKEFQRKAKSLAPALRIGKSGLSAGVIKEVSHQLNKKGIIKIRLLRTGVEERNKKEMVDRIAESCKAFILEDIGNTITICKTAMIK